MVSTVLNAIQTESLEALSEALRGAKNVALVDFPNHENSGDSLIYLGEMAYLEQLGVSVDYVTDYARYNSSDLRRALPVGPVLIHGGGNFGNRWEHLQIGREKIISDFPDRQIIQLPQTIDFEPGESLGRAQRVLGSHPDLTIFIRDHQGVVETQSLFPNTTVKYCPDMAFGYGPIYTTINPSYDLLVLKRGDVESVHSRLVEPLQGQTVKTDDWGMKGLRKLAYIALHLPGALTKRVPALAFSMNRVLRWCFGRMAQLNVDNAVAILAAGEVVVTDRLHAAVMGVLMDKQVVALDNANGKISAIMNDYLGEFQNTHYVNSAVDAHKALLRFKVR